MNINEHRSYSHWARRRRLASVWDKVYPALLALTLLFGYAVCGYLEHV